MSVIYMLISISIVVALIFFFLFVKAVRTGQYDDSHTPAVRMLFEDELVEEAPTEKENIKNTNKQLT
ncbi:cbb3-type cytochrome oxidase assembly protein CcoS [Capnocytophaga canimorsus]|uniref:Cbb3-type cytochrome oxidase assembly protein CcoS n=1 Tax=Capnocytophaga canimorsus TaxID=28188 RepID=A0AAC9Z3N7_9FLAO|nr:cbb3-type cytochrome oxidase assembly protein CcoS [Capnocytophaga canimorsus]ATA93858.1 cbb3-type cytochrome oxidase assembly protein CcoS [Capnocytophaga canimorsus]GIM58047.1 cytochrome oxidase maturation protein Cbb3 [Capnocytophaga canimorsus]